MTERWRSIGGPRRHGPDVQTMHEERRPLLRGVSHQIAFFVVIVAGAVLISRTTDRRATVATVIYALTLAGMFGVSALLHRRDWGPRMYGWLRRADHAMIFACIAGTYTPFCMLGLTPPAGPRLLIMIWSGAGIGILRAVLWPHAPRAVSSVLYVVVGWVMLVYFPEVRTQFPPAAFALLVAGGGSFTVGAAVYGFRWPDPLPRVFGYHEVFHLLVILGCACHFAAISVIVHAR
jgi:hemolysin III